MARNPWEMELGTGQDWISSNIAAFRCIEELDKFVSTSCKYHFCIRRTVHGIFCASFPSVFLLSYKWKLNAYQPWGPCQSWKITDFHGDFTTVFLYFSSTDCLDTLNLVVADAAINIWQGSLLKESHYCVMTKLQTAQMEKIRVAGVTLRHFLSALCFVLQSCLFILICT